MPNIGLLTLNVGQISVTVRFYNPALYTLKMSSQCPDERGKHVQNLITPSGVALDPHYVDLNFSLFHFFRGRVHSGGSRISQRWGANRKSGGRTPIVFANFPKNWM